MMIALSAITMIFAWAMVYAEAKERHLITYLAKTGASVCFVINGFLAAFYSSGEKILILLLLAGLVFGMLGDLFLCRKHIAREEFWDIMLTVGGIFFLSGHLCYFLAFFLKAENHRIWVYLIVPALMAIVFALMKSGQWKIREKDRMNYLGYAAVSGLMLSSAIELVLEKSLTEEWILAAAAAIFILSDLTLATWNFGKFHTIWMRYICISLYYIAQILFVFGIRFC